MRQVNMHEAKSQLSALVEQAEKGEEIIIARNGKPAVRLVPVEKKGHHVKLGTMKGKIWIADNFDDPLPDDVLITPEP